ncbi:MAG TPA: GlsB/YeaQ/YmgE family stress response membrane protein [Caulobacteraceae bacterium]|nr:GlsB/YeaQ/YmgE family stress response membrane protein [Caulobacteraceae bacterium]
MHLHHSIGYWLIVVAIGAVAGWLAGLIFRGRGFGLIGDIILGVLGSFLGAWLFHRVGVNLPGGYLGSFVAAIVGAGILVLILRLLRR